MKLPFKSADAAYAEIVMRGLRQCGCDPSIYARGDRLYRAHVNRAGNHWHDASTKSAAIRGAVMMWIKSERDRSER